jgi:hypothetical protein
LAVPERVLIFVTIVDAAGELQSAVIQRIALVALPEKIMGDAEIVIGFINGNVAVGGLSLKTDLGTRQILGLPGIINVAFKQARRGDVGRGRAPGTCAIRV